MKLALSILAVIIAIAACFATSAKAAQTPTSPWTYRDMYEARKACAEYYFSIYTAGKDMGRNPAHIRDEDIQSFWTVARQAAADMVEFASILNDPYTKPTFTSEEWDSRIPAGVVLPYSNGAAIPYFGSDFQYAIPGYSVVPPAEVVRLREAQLPKDEIVSLYNANGYSDNAQVTPDHVYIYGVGMNRTIADVAKAHWYPTLAEAVANGPAPVIPPPFGEAPPVPGPVQIREARGVIQSDGTLKIDTWFIVPSVSTSSR